MSYQVVILSQESYFSQFRQFFQPKQGVYGPGEVAMLSAQWSVLAGGSCESAEVEFSAPFYFRSRDRLAIYLLPAGELVWQGEIRSEPWRVGGGGIRAVGYAENVGKARWSGLVSNNFQNAIYDIISRCTLPVGVFTGYIHDPASLVRSNPAFELLKSTLDIAATALNGGIWGVNASLQIFIKPRNEDVGHFFYINDGEINTSDISSPINGVRLEVKDGLVSYIWEANITGDNIIHGDQYDVVQVPPFLALDSENLLPASLPTELGTLSFAATLHDVEFVALAGIGAGDLRAGDQIRFTLQEYVDRPAIAPTMNDAVNGWALYPADQSAFTPIPGLPLVQLTALQVLGGGEFRVQVAEDYRPTLPNQSLRDALAASRLVFFRKRPPTVEYPALSGIFVQAGNSPNYGPEIGDIRVSGRDAATLNSYALGLLRKSLKADTSGKGTIQIRVNEDGEAVWPVSVVNEGLVRFGFENGGSVVLELQRLTWIIDSNPRIEVEAGSYLNLPTEEQTARAIQSMKERIQYA
jgi:hypothetical protein